MGTDYHPAELMIVEMARSLRPGERVFHGVASPLPMIAIQLALRTHAPDLVYLNIPGGINTRPHPLPISTAHPSLSSGTPSIFPLMEVFDLAARGGLDVVFLSGAQVDMMGNVNLSVIGEFHRPRVRLPGGAGSAFLISTSKRAILWKVDHSPRTLPKRCDFFTAANWKTRKVEKLITSLATFRMGEEGFELESLHPHTTLREVKERTGFPFPTPDRPPYTLPPSEEELALIREIDPEGRRFLEFK